MIDVTSDTEACVLKKIKDLRGVLSDTHDTRETLTKLVVACAENLAEDINSSGLACQLQFLLKEGWETEVVTRLVKNI